MSCFSAPRDNEAEKKVVDAAGGDELWKLIQPRVNEMLTDYIKFDAVQRHYISKTAVDSEYITKAYVEKHFIRKDRVEQEFVRREEVEEEYVKKNKFWKEPANKKTLGTFVTKDDLKETKNELKDIVTKQLKKATRSLTITKAVSMDQMKKIGGKGIDAELKPMKSDIVKMKTSSVWMKSDIRKIKSQVEKLTKKKKADMKSDMQMLGRDTVKETINQLKKELEQVRNELNDSKKSSKKDNRIVLLTVNKALLGALMMGNNANSFKYNIAESINGVADLKFIKGQVECFEWSTKDVPPSASATQKATIKRLSPPSSEDDSIAKEARAVWTDLFDSVCRSVETASLSTDESREVAMEVEE